MDSDQRIRSCVRRSGIRGKEVSLGLSGCRPGAGIFERNVVVDQHYLHMQAANFCHLSVPCKSYKQVYVENNEKQLAALVRWLAVRLTS